MDQLTTLLSHFSLNAGVFYTGNICGIHDFQKDPLRGHLHLIRSGSMQVTGVQQDVLNITEPTLLFLPRPQTHRLLAEGRAGSDVVCGTVQIGGGGHNPVTDSLPDVGFLTQGRSGRGVISYEETQGCVRTRQAASTK